MKLLCILWQRWRDHRRRVHHESESLAAQILMLWMFACILWTVIALLVTKH
jgi:hypothetical protein